MQSKITPLTTITEENKNCILQHGSKSSQSNSTTPYRNLQNKFLLHFETINTHTSSDNLQYNTKMTSNNENAYMSKMQQYCNTSSPIDRIVCSNQSNNLLNFGKKDINFVTNVPIGSLRPEIKAKIQTINGFFAGCNSQYVQVDFDNTVFELRNYTKVLSHICQKINYNKQRQVINEIKLANHRSIEVNTELPFITTRRDQQQLPTFRKADMILIEILRQKKRKSLVTDYYAIMQSKLMELLHYILEDEPEYQGLTGTDKIKLVLKNLEHFKGKKIQGERKIDLLRVFFQEFRNLKDDHTKKINYESGIPPISTHKNTRQYIPEGASTVKKWHKEYRNTETMSVGQATKKQSQRNAAKKSTKSVKQSEDHWIGELQ